MRAKSRRAIATGTRARCSWYFHGLWSLAANSFAQAEEDEQDILSIAKWYDELPDVLKREKVPHSFALRPSHPIHAESHIIWLVRFEQEVHPRSTQKHGTPGDLLDVSTLPLAHLSASQSTSQGGQCDSTLMRAFHPISYRRYVWTHHHHHHLNQSILQLEAKGAEVIFMDRSRIQGAIAGLVHQQLSLHDDTFSARHVLEVHGR